ncbi:hypothetical protein [Alkalibacillus flavidus]|uniref:hypothetical protein n=1 Tax=Alkalibacillus flavidus TaxID=546021 RepID=UPI00367287FE
MGGYHWSSYQESSADENQSMVDETVTVEERGQDLVIEHRLDKIEVESAKLNVPDSVQELTCLEEGCDYSDSRLTVNASGVYTLSYVVPKQSIVSDVIYMSDWLVNINHDALTDQKRDIRISLSAEQEGAWYSLNTPILNSERENIHYYEWQHHNVGEPPLIKVSHPFSHTQRLDQLTVLSNRSVASSDIQILRDVINQSHNQVLIVDDSLNEVITDHLVVVRQLDQSIESLFSRFLKSISSDSSADAEVIDVLTAFYYDNDNEDKMVQVLNDVLTEDEQALWFQQLMDLETNQGNLTAIADDLLSQLLGYDVSFFTYNQKSSTYVPFYGDVTKQVMVQGEESDIDLKQREETIYMAIDTFLDRFDLYGFSVDNRNEWFAEYDADQMRFYINRNVYTINDRRYQVPETAWFQAQGKTYIELSLLARIFDRTYNQNDERIEIE